MLPDDSYQYGQCKSSLCRATILWARYESGKAVPLDPEPSTQGNVKLLGNGLARVMGKRETEDDTSSDRYAPHFASCAGAIEFRKGYR